MRYVEMRIALVIKCPETLSMIKLLKVARPQFLVGGLTIYLLGALWAILLGAKVSPVPLVLGILAVLSSQLSVHFSNDYFDVESDRPGSETFISGGAGVLVEHPELREPARRIAIGLILFSLFLGVLLTWLYSYPALVPGAILVGNLLGWFYSAPPLRLAASGWGAFCYPLISGFIVPSLGYLLMRGELDRAGLFFTIPLVLYGFVTVLTVQIPDMEVDRLSAKRTWVARWGRPFGFIAVGLLLLAATSYFFLYPQLSPRPIPADLQVLGLFSLFPLGFGLWGAWKRPAERRPATRIATAIMLALAGFGPLVDVYLLYLILQS